jgi:hypothetical protein
MHIEINLSLGDYNDAELLVLCDTYVAQMTGNPLFAAPQMVAQVANVAHAVTTLRNSINAIETLDKRDLIGKASDALRRTVTKLKNMVQDQANDPDVADIDRESIVHGAAMVIKIHGERTSNFFKAIHGIISGTIKLVAHGSVNGHQWKYTFDTKEYTNCIHLDSTTIAEIEITDLPVKTEVACFHRAVVAGTKTDWEGPVIITVL